MFDRLKQVKLGDWIIILLILLITTAIWFGTKSEGRIAVVCQNNALLYEIDLNDPANEGKQFVIQGDYSNTIVVKQREIYVSESTCPDQVCKHSHPVGRDGGVICCVPNGVIITVEQHSGWDVIIQ